jgi:hypothetical protein
MARGQPLCRRVQVFARSGAWFHQVSLRLGTAFVGARFRSTKSITDFLLCDRAKHPLQQEFPIRRRCLPHCLLECRDRLQCACRATRVILVEYLREEQAKGYKRGVDAIFKPNALGGQSRLDYIVVEDLVKRKSVGVEG